MTHGREKLRLGPRGPFRGGAGGIEEATSFLETGNAAGWVFDDPTKFDEVDNLAAEGGQGLELVRGEFAGLSIDDAERAASPAVLSHDRRSGVETDVRIVEDEWMVGEAVVAERVGDDKDPGGGFDDGMGAERIAPRGFGDVETDPGFEPLPIGAIREKRAMGT